MRFIIFTPEDIDSGEYDRTMAKLKPVSEEQFGDCILVHYI